jgi:hypothetical protein
LPVELQLLKKIWFDVFIERLQDWKIEKLGSL